MNRMRKCEWGDSDQPGNVIFRTFLTVKTNTLNKFILVYDCGVELFSFRLNKLFETKAKSYRNRRSKNVPKRPDFSKKVLKWERSVEKGMNKHPYFDEPNTDYNPLLRLKVVKFSITTPMKSR